MNGDLEYPPRFEHVAEAVSEALRHFYHLDHSNAAFHCAEVRYSPITFRLASALVELDPSESHVDPARTVLFDVGRYEEDKGR
jgi:hypothetical protein